MANKLSKGQLGVRAQRVAAILAQSAWCEGRSDGDLAARLRAEAREMATDPDFGNMFKQAERYDRIARTVTAATEKAEADALLATEAVTKAFKETGRAGGKKGGRPAGTDWQAPALSLANELDRRKYWFTAKIATELIASWDVTELTKKIRRPGYRQLYDFLCACEKDGRLKPRKCK